MKSPIILSGLQRRGFLLWACNKFGDFKVATRFNDGKWSKHKSVLEIWHNEEEWWRLEKANNRTLFPPEIVLDVDLREGETIEAIGDRFEQITTFLISENYEFYAYFSGSKGYHIHLIFPEIVSKGEARKKELKQFFINKFGCDMMKASEGSMIALEFTPHWKTGNPKRLVMYNNTFPPEPLESMFLQNG